MRERAREFALHFPEKIWMQHKRGSLRRDELYRVGQKLMREAGLVIVAEDKEERRREIVRIGRQFLRESNQEVKICHT
jgi:hypothetical protein